MGNNGKRRGQYKSDAAVAGDRALVQEGSGGVDQEHEQQEGKDGVSENEGLLGFLEHQVFETAHFLYATDIGDFQVDLVVLGQQLWLPWSCHAAYFFFFYGTRNFYF